jgi:hypothetical protein
MNALRVFLVICVISNIVLLSLLARVSRNPQDPPVISAPWSYLQKSEGAPPHCSTPQTVDTPHNLADSKKLRVIEKVRQYVVNAPVTQVFQTYLAN